jgi:glutaredoxin 3
MQIDVYTRSDCSFCLMAKNLLHAMGKPFTEHKLDIDFTREQLLEQFPNAKTYPIVVVDGFTVGGYTELYKYLTEQTVDNKTLLNEGDGI